MSEENGNEVGDKLVVGAAPNTQSSSPPTARHTDSDSSHSPSLLKDQERFLPIANISRIMKKALPQHAKIAKDAKETVQHCVSEFISFITSEASEKCQNEKRKTINGEDILWAMQALGFDNYQEPLKLYHSKYREAMQNAPKQRTPSKQYGSKKDDGTSPPPSPSSHLVYHQPNVYGVTYSLQPTYVQEESAEKEGN